MSTLAISLLEAPEWSATFDAGTHKVKAIVSSFPQIMHHERATIRYYMLLRQVNGAMDEVFDNLNRLLREAESGELQQMQHDTEPEAVINLMISCYDVLNLVYTVGAVRGNKRQLLTRGQMHRLHEFMEQITDWIDWAKQNVDPEFMRRAKNSYEAGMAELEAGETVALF